MSTEVQVKRHRSPEYPSLPLGEALARAEKLMAAKFGKHMVPVDDVLAAWGYSPGSGNGLVQLAALIRYGLMQDEGSRKDRLAGLTSRAYDILIDEREDSEDRLHLIQQAALTPSLNRELWEEHKVNPASPPPDSSLKFRLRREGFSDAAAVKAIEVYRATIAFSKLAESDTLSKRREEAERKSREELDTVFRSLMPGTTGSPLARQHDRVPPQAPAKPAAAASGTSPLTTASPPGGTSMSSYTGIPVPQGGGRAPAMIIGLTPKSAEDLTKIKARIADVIDMWFEDLLTGGTTVEPSGVEGMNEQPGD